jgi:hypothetical protein
MKLMALNSASTNNEGFSFQSLMDEIGISFHGWQREVFGHEAEVDADEIWVLGI